MSREPDRLIYCGYSGRAAWAFGSAEELGAWAAEHPEGTIDVIVAGAVGNQPKEQG